MTVYLTVDDVLSIHARFENGVRDLGLIESAVTRPQTSAFGEDAYPSVARKAAAMTESLVRNHGFVDGNKRTALVSLVKFMMINGYSLVAEAGDQVDAMVYIAEGVYDLDKITEWIEAGFGETPLELN